MILVAGFLCAKAVRGETPEQACSNGCLVATNLIQITKDLVAYAQHAQSNEVYGLVRQIRDVGGNLHVLFTLKETHPESIEAAITFVPDIYIRTKLLAAVNFYNALYPTLIQDTNNPNALHVLWCIQDTYNNGFQKAMRQSAEDYANSHPNKILESIKRANSPNMRLVAPKKQSDTLGVQ